MAGESGLPLGTKVHVRLAQVLVADLSDGGPYPEMSRQVRALGKVICQVPAPHVHLIIIENMFCPCKVGLFKCLCKGQGAIVLSLWVVYQLSHVLLLTALPHPHHVP